MLPGQGAFADCSRGLLAVSGMRDAIEKATLRGAPFLGICVWMQLMAECGLEHEITPGFGWITGEIAERLQAIYIFCKKTLIEARIQRQGEKIGQVVALLANLREAWARLAEQAKLKPDPVGDFFQGGTFCSQEFDGDTGRVWKA